jgi:Histidine phosphatase superfamily (branch 2)
MEMLLLVRAGHIVGWLVLLQMTVLGPAAVEASTRSLTSSDSSSHFRYNARQNWYTRYKAYPDYCSTSMENDRAIPPLLQHEETTGSTRLLHVSVVIRHGARTPWNALDQMHCWPGFPYNSTTHGTDDDAAWNCQAENEIQTILGTPSSRTIAQKEKTANSTTSTSAMFLFPKYYDSLPSSSPHLHNNLQGSCQQGQLILRGYDQMVTNGKLLRQAYLYDGTKYTHDQRLRLIDTASSTKPVWDPSNIYFRSDDGTFAVYCFALDSLPRC